MEKLKNPKFIADIKQLRDTLQDKIGTLNYLIDTLESNQAQPQRLIIDNKPEQPNRNLVDYSVPQEEVQKAQKVVERHENKAEDFNKHLENLEFDEVKHKPEHIPVNPNSMSQHIPDEDDEDIEPL